MRRPLSLVVLALGLVATTTPHTADACGTFARDAAPVPSLSLERVLIVHDEAKGLEHFVREVVFRDGDQTFGFVVPVPAKPEVAAVKKHPFGGLGSEFPMEPPVPPGPPGPRGGLSDIGGAGGVGPRDGVTVLDVKQVGTFKAFVLSASDAGGLRKWLDDNQFTTTKASEEWLDGYVKQRFFFVAMRHDPPSPTPSEKKSEKKPGAVITETTRISFATPVPYYPYREPDRGTVGDERLVALWLVTNSRARVPVAVRARDGASRLVRPFHEGSARYTLAPDSVAKAVGDELTSILPRPAAGETTLRVQVFEDQKRSRQGFGDVLFVAKTPVKPGDAARLEAILDPTVAGTP